MSESSAPRPAAAWRQRHQEIYSAIRTRISLLDYPPGRRLSEEALAEEFRVSRTPLRRVLTRLEAEGLLRSVQGVGTMVTDFDLGSLAQAYALRMELAGLIGRLDPIDPAGTAEPLRRLREIQARCDGEGGSPRSFAEANLDFFEVLMTLTSNRPLRRMKRQLHYQTARIWISSLSDTDLGTERRGFGREMAEVIEALALGDLAAIGHIRRAHISMSFSRLRERRLEGPAVL